MIGKTLARAGAILVLVLVLALAPWLAFGHAYADSPETVKIRVEITDEGFNDRPDLVLEVEQGKLVELTFVFAHKAAINDRHIIVLKGLGLETPEIDYYNREATLKFVADKSGSFEFACELACEVHDRLKRGVLKVKGAGAAGGGAGSSVALAPTTLAVYPSRWETAGEAVKLSASLKDGTWAPVAKATVRFFVETEFAGTRGEMEVGAARTDASGLAAVTYKPTFPGVQRITARFEGMGLYGESEKIFQIQVASADPAYTVAPRGLEGVSDRVPFAVALIILAIWSAFGYVLYEVYRIRRAGRKGGERGTS